MHGYKRRTTTRAVYEARPAVVSTLPAVLQRSRGHGDSATEGLYAYNIVIHIVSTVLRFCVQKKRNGGRKSYANPNGTRRWTDK